MILQHELIRLETEVAKNRGLLCVPISHGRRFLKQFFSRYNFLFSSFIPSFRVQKKKYYGNKIYLHFPLIFENCHKGYFFSCSLIHSFTYCVHSLLWRNIILIVDNFIAYCLISTHILNSSSLSLLLCLFSSIILFERGEINTIA